MIDARTIPFHFLPAFLCAVSGDAHAETWYVAPDGTPRNAGTPDSPWDIASALSGGQKVSGGDTVYLLAGTYKRRPEALFDIRLVGSAEKPIHVRPLPGTRATIDGGLAVQKPSAHVWVRDLEILVSENFSMSRELDEPGSHPKSYNRPWGGLHLHGGNHCRYINLVIRDCAQGISAWVGATDVEIYGCLIHDNGWKAPDRGHGHAIYTQNRDGTKTIRHCILSARYPGSYTMHAYGSSRAYVDNFLVEENIAHGLGPFLIGGGRPSRDVRAIGNVLHDVSMRIGYNAPHNEDCEVRNNVIVNGSLSIQRFRNTVEEGNVIIRKSDARPSEARAFWFPNRFDPDRAHLAVVNGSRTSRVEIPARPFLSAGDRFRIMSPRDIHGEPLHRGRCTDGTITFPMKGEFGAFVTFRERAKRPEPAK